MLELQLYHPPLHSSPWPFYYPACGVVGGPLLGLFPGGVGGGPLLSLVGPSLGILHGVVDCGPTYHPSGLVLVPP